MILLKPLLVNKMITGSQIRSARAALRWSAEKLSQKAGVGIQTIKRMEQTDVVPASNASTLRLVKITLEAAGIEFIGTPEEGPGIRLFRSKS
jgi:ribosome-binding protein aMBF1 (putative translation factor)